MLLPRNHHLQMSSCLAAGGVGGGGGGRAYTFELEILKSPSPSPSSTLSDSSNSGLVIVATRKPRTPRKRPNQTYNEAAALLSTAYPKLFSSAATAAAATSRTFSKSPSLSSSSPSSSTSSSSSELFFPFRIVDDDSTFLITDKPGAVRESERSNSSSTLSEKSCPSPGEFDSQAVNLMDLDCEAEEDFYFDYAAESILDEEADDGGGIDSIMGNPTVKSSDNRAAATSEDAANTCYGYPMGMGLGLGFELGFGIQRGGFVRALRHADGASHGGGGGGGYNWWSFPAVDMVELSPRLRRPSEKKAKAKKKKMKKVAAVVEREKAAEAEAELEGKPTTVSGAGAGDGEGESLELPKARDAGLGLLLKLNYDGILREWSGKGSPFSDEGDTPKAGGQNDVAVGSLSSSSARKPKSRKEKQKVKK